MSERKQQVKTEFKTLGEQYDDLNVCITNLVEKLKAADKLEYTRDIKTKLLALLIILDDDKNSETLRDAIAEVSDGTK